MLTMRAGYWINEKDETVEIFGCTVSQKPLHGRWVGMVDFEELMLFNEKGEASEFGADLIEYVGNSYGQLQHYRTYQKEQRQNRPAFISFSQKHFQTDAFSEEVMRRLITINSPSVGRGELDIGGWLERIPEAHRPLAHWAASKALIAVLGRPLNDATIVDFISVVISHVHRAVADPRIVD